MKNEKKWLALQFAYEPENGIRVTHKSYGPVRDFGSYCIHTKTSLNAHADVSGWAGDQNLGPVFIYIQTLCMRAVKALTSLRTGICL